MIKKIITIKEAAELLNLKTSTLYQLTSRKEIPHFKIGALLRFYEDDLEDWLNSKKVIPMQEHKS